MRRSGRARASKRSHADVGSEAGTVDGGEDLFPPIPKPGPDDWLAQYKDDGQTYAEWVASVDDPYVPVAKRSRIYVRPVECSASGDSGNALGVSALTEFLKRFLYPLPVAVLPALKLVPKPSSHTGGKAKSKSKSKAKKKAESTQAFVVETPGSADKQQHSVAFRR